MAGFSDLEATLQASSLSQLGFAFVAVIGYGVAQGRLVGAVGRTRAWVLALLSAAGFCLQSDQWVHGAVLVAFGVVGIGLFAALVFGLSRVLGVEQPAGVESEAAWSVSREPGELNPATPEAQQVRPSAHNPAHST